MGLTLGLGLSTLAVFIRVYTKAVLTKSLKVEDCEYFRWRLRHGFARFTTKSKQISQVLVGYDNP